MRFCPFERKPCVGPAVILRAIQNLKSGPGWPGPVDRLVLILVNQMLPYGGDPQPDETGKCKRLGELFVNKFVKL